jgi:hypothetical protein
VNLDLGSVLVDVSGKGILLVAFERALHLYYWNELILVKYMIRLPLSY